MAEVIATKSTNVVSNEKSDVCDTKSNSVLMEFDKITQSSSQLIHICNNNDHYREKEEDEGKEKDDDDDDDNKVKFILENNLEKKLNINENSLQELIENELALRKCINNECKERLIDNSNCENKEKTFSEPTISITKMSGQLGQHYSSANTSFIEKEIEYCNISHELSIYQLNTDIDCSNVGENAFDKQTLKNFQTNNVIDKLLLMDTELNVNEKDTLINLKDNDSYVNCDTDKFEIVQHPMNNKCLQDEYSNSSLNNLHYELSGFRDNTIEKDKLIDDVPELLTDINIITPLMSFDIKNVDSAMSSTYNTLIPAENLKKILISTEHDTQKINENTNNDELQEKQIDSFDYQCDILSDKNIPTNFSTMIPDEKNGIQYEEINDVDFQKISHSVDKKNIFVEDITIGTMKTDMNVTTAINETNNPKDICSACVNIKCMSCAMPAAQLHISDDQINNESFNAFNHDIHEELLTTNSTIGLSTVKNLSKTKKKKSADNIANNEVQSPNSHRTKKTKKNKKNDLEKENISVNINRSEDTSANASNGSDYIKSEGILNFDDLSYVNVKSLTQCYATVSTGYGMQEKCKKDAIETGVSIKLLKSSFNKFDALSKQSIFNNRSLDTTKTHQQLNTVGQNGDTNPNCHNCDKVVFQMEQTKAEGLIWHKNCFRCVQCSKQLSVDNYESHECKLYCKAHFRELFQPKPVDESDQPTSDKPDLGLKELSSLNVKSRFEVFEKKSEFETISDFERSPSQISVKRSPSILSKLAKFQAKGMDIGIADETLNGIPYEESSDDSDRAEEGEEENVGEFEVSDAEIIKSKRMTRERPMNFNKMDDMKSRWEETTQQGKRESQREARKEEIAGIRSRLFMGKQGKMKEMYQQAVATSERIVKINPAEEIQCSAQARSIKEKFERGEPIADDENQDDNKAKQDKPDEDIIAAGISRKSRSLFLELDASAAKSGGSLITPTHSKVVPDIARRARDMSSPVREIYRDPDVIRADDKPNNIVYADTTKKMLSIFRQMEEKSTKEDIPDGPKPLKRFTPPPEDKYAKATASESDEDGEEDGIESSADSIEEERDPNYVRASDKVEDEFLKQAQNAAKAKMLRAKFEQWETNDEKMVNHNNMIDMEMNQNKNSEHASIESAKSLRARFESLGSQSVELPRTQKCKVNRFVKHQIVAMDTCDTCRQKVYPLEKVETNKKVFHKHCFRCLQCNCILRMDTFTLNNGKLYCIPHFKQLFIARGNYDEGFGVNPHKNKWSANSVPTTEIIPMIIANGEANQIINND